MRNAAGAYAAQDDESWNGTDSDTSSDDDGEIIVEPGLENMTNAEAAEHIYMQYRRGKRLWRRFTGKPVRRFRRTLKRFKHQYARQKGYGKQRGFLWTRDDAQMFFKRKGKRKRQTSLCHNGKRFWQTPEP